MPGTDRVELAKRLVDPFDSFGALDAAFNRVMYPRRLQDHIGHKGTIEAVDELITLLESWGELDAIERIIAAAPRTFDHQIFDLAQIDLADIVSTFKREWLLKRGPTFVGAGIVTTSAVLPKLRRRLAGVIGANDPRDPWPLDPAIRTPAQVLDLFERARGADREILISIEVASTVDAPALAEVWQTMSTRTSGRSKPMLVLFSTVTAMAFPNELIQLPSPRFCIDQVNDWVTTVGDALKWEEEWSRTVTLQIWDEIAAGADEVDPYLLYDTLQAHGEDIQADPEAFRARMCA